MNTIDYIALSFMGISVIGAAYSFAVIEKYLIDHNLVNRKASYPNVLDFYKKYTADTKIKTGLIGPWFWVHICSAAVFILLGMLYAVFRLTPYILSYFKF